MRRLDLSVLRKRWRWGVSGLVLAVAVGLLIIASTPRVYEASTEIFVSAASSDAAQQLAQGNTFVQARVQSYTNVATSPAVTDFVVSELGLDMSGSELADEITASAPLNKVIIDITVASRDRSRVASIANAVSTRFTTVVQQLEITPGSTTSPVKLTVTQPASTPTAPSKPDVSLILAVSLLAGLLAGLALIALRDLLDNTVESSSDITEVLGLSTFANVAFDKNVRAAPIASQRDPKGRRAEAFRQLRSNLQFVHVDNPPKVIAVSSALPAEGKTACAVNLAATLAEAGFRVCLVEADLRKPTLASLTGLISNPGLTDVLMRTIDVEDALQNLGPNLAAITAGASPPNPSELLTSQSFSELLKSLAQHLDFVVVDTAPLLPVVDGADVAARCDATLLVVRARKASRAQLRQAITNLSQLGVEPVGAVLSMSRKSAMDKGDYYYGYGTENSKSQKSSDIGDAKVQ